MHKTITQRSNSSYTPLTIHFKFPAFFLPLKRSSLKNPTVLETGLNLQKLAKPLSANMTPKLTFSAALSCTALRRSTPLTYFWMPL